MSTRLHSTTHFTDWTEEAIEKSEAMGERAFEQQCDRDADTLERHMKDCPKCKLGPFGFCVIASNIIAGRTVE